MHVALSCPPLSRVGEYGGEYRDLTKSIVSNSPGRLEIVEIETEKLKLVKTLYSQVPLNKDHIYNKTTCIIRLPLKIRPPHYSSYVK